MRPLPHVRGVSVRRLTAALIASVAISICAASLSAPANARNDIDSKVSIAGDDVAAANKSVARAEEMLRRATAELPAAQAAAAKAQRIFLKAQAADRIVELELERTTAAALRAEQSAIESQARIDLMHARVNQFASDLYMQGPLANLAVILDSADITDFAANLTAIDRTSKANNQTFDDLDAAKADSALKQARAEALRAQAQVKRDEVAKRFVAAQRLRAEALSTTARVNALIRGRANALNVANREKTRVLAEYRALKAEQERARRASQGGGWTGPPPVGDWDWPIPGAGISAFVGPRVHPVYGYRSCHTGVDIRGGYGAAIHSPQPGIVVAIQSGGPYGLHTFISHGSGIVSMYAHQSQVRVSVGEKVGKGEVIGLVGSSGWVTGPHLHFEMHVNGVPFDPLGWYGGRKVKVSCA